MHNYHITIILAVLVIFSGCRVEKSGRFEVVSNVNHPRKNTSRRLKRSDVKEAYKRARTSMLLEDQVYVDVLWVLTQLEKNDRELDAFIAEKKKTIPDPSYVPGVFPRQPRKVLPEHPGTGVGKFFTYVQAAFGQPKDRALLYLQDYIAGQNSGYILTHQFLCLIWAEQAGLPMSDEIFSRKQELWEKIYDEQRATDNVDSIDLYMERVAIILMYRGKNKVEKENVDQWIQIIIEMQLPDGSWPLSKTRIHYDGASTQLSSPSSHTTVLAMMALHAYINNSW